jgi:hypothetical protein
MSEKSIPVKDLLAWHESERKSHAQSNELLNRARQNPEILSNLDPAEVTQFEGKIQGQLEILQSFAAFIIAQTNDTEGDFQNWLDNNNTGQ